MTHLDEDTLVAVRDGDGADGWAARHLRGCSSCSHGLEEARRRSQAIAEALAELDEPVDALRAKAAVRGRLDARRGDAPARGAWWHAHLGRAAALLILTAGAASALPWSPIRHWWVGPPVETTSGPAAGAFDGAGSAQGAPAAGISVAVPEGGIAVILTGVEPGTVIDVQWVERPTARVSAPPGSGFTYADGRAEVEAAPGPIEVELPRAAEAASLRVDGRLFLERAGERLDVPGPVVQRTDDGVRFVVPAD